VKAHYAIIDRVCGALLVVVGVLMATGQLGLWLRLLA
jgi:cytochrome c-type biogenesis protein